MSTARRALITGGGSGIGTAVARALVAHGARVLITGRDAAKLQTVAAEAPEQIGVCVADLTIEADRQRLADFAARWEGVGIDTLINNAGVGGGGFFDSMDVDRINAVVQANLIAPICLTQSLLSHLKSLAEARIVNIGSVFGYIGYPSQAVYSASKFGLRGFSEALGRELDETSVRVHHIAPRATRTAMNSSAMDELNRALGNRVDEPERVAAALIKALTRERTNTVIGWREALFARVNAIFPSLVDGALIKQLPVIRQFMQRGTNP
ncbi:MAG: SDR family oxidoreductase [Gammaproteobacteria bacterium]|nr:SDR family oxidoreductase [Gammaproteobacteria bacterium]